MKTQKVKGGYIYTVAADEISTIHYVKAWHNGETVKQAYDRVSKSWGSAPDFLINAELFDARMNPASDVVEKGKVHRLTETHGMAFPRNNSVRWSYKNNVNAPDYVGAYPALLRNGSRGFDVVPVGLGGSRGRTAIATDDSGRLYVALIPDGSNDMTLTELANALLAAGATDAANLDGGGSTQWVAPGSSHSTGRKVRGFVGVWLKKGAIKKPDDIRTVKVKTALNVRKSSTIFSGVVGKLYNGQSVSVLEERGSWCRIALGWVSSAYLVKQAQPPPVADVPIITDYIPFTRQNRPGRANPRKYITIHETGNAARGANSKAHANYLKSTKDKVSWHYTVDDAQVYRHIPDSEDAFHAGDGAGPGNRQSIGIEICVNVDGDFQRAVANAAWLVRKLRADHGIPLANVVQHNRWSGKNCPQTLRKSGWAEFIKMC